MPSLTTEVLGEGYRTGGSQALTPAPATCLVVQRCIAQSVSCLSRNWRVAQRHIAQFGDSKAKPVPGQRGGEDLREEPGKGHVLCGA